MPDSPGSQAAVLIAELHEAMLELAGGCVLEGEAPSVRRLRSQIELAAGSEASVLIEGEFGAGKEAVARSIHQSSTRREKAFIQLRLGENESATFGRASGTSRVAEVLTAVDEMMTRSSGGTLYISGLEVLKPSGQSALWRWLGESKSKAHGNPKLITATDRDLKPDVDAEVFDRKLFLQLSVLRIELEPLRELRTEIPHLAQRFAEAAARRFHRPTPHLTSAQAQLLGAYDWPGNLRELQNVIERGVILGAGGLMRLDFEGAARSPGDRGGAPTGSAGSGVVTRDELRRRERDNLVAGLARAHGRIFGPAGAARALGMKPTTLLSRIRALGIPRHPGRAPNVSETEVIPSAFERTAPPARKIAAPRRRKAVEPAPAPSPTPPPSFEVSFD